MKHDVLLVGSGGREHALAWKLRQSPLLGKLLVAPGNAGTDCLGENVPIFANDIPAIIRLASDRAVDVVIVGPEDAMVRGLTDALAAESILTIAPSRDAAAFLVSEDFIDPFLDKISGSGFRMEYAPLAGTGESELSIHAFCSEGATILTPICRKCMRLYDGDQGPMTAGMGAVAPAPDLDDDVTEWTNRVVQDALAVVFDKTQQIYKGILNVTFALSTTGRPRIVAFSCSFGDPEAQALLPLLRGDLLEIMLSIGPGELNSVPVKWSNGQAVAVVMTSEGYPGPYQTGKPITGIEEATSTALVFHGGTRLKGGTTVTARGRVLTSVGVSIDDAAER